MSTFVHTTRVAWWRHCSHWSGRWFLLVLLLGLAGTGDTRAAQVSFENEVMAVLSRAGCNAGGCHGNASGKAGLKLSLRGEDSDWDFNALTRDQFGRRVNLVEPGQSLLLLKATAKIGHEGGRRFAPDSREHQILRDWIAQGCSRDAAEAPKLSGLEVEPRQAVLVEPQDSFRITVRARFTDGSERMVNDLATFDQSGAAATVSSDGEVRRARFGETTILVRYLNQQLPVRVAFVPNRPAPPLAGFHPNNFIDQQVLAKLRTLRMEPSGLCSDEVFLRRAFLDTIGLLPTPEEARHFMADRRRDKRAGLVRALLQRPEFADFWALKWSDLLRLEERALDTKGMHRFHEWNRDSIATGKPMDQFAREMIAARGSTYEHPEANYYRANRDAVTRGEATAQVFLGTRLQCAQCHNHPFDRWTQDDYYNWSALFARVQYKVLENRRQDENDSHEFKGEQVVYLARSGEIKNPKSGKAARPAFLGAKQLEAGADELTSLADWVVDPANPYFARAQANRIWYHLMGRGIVDPIDDFRATNPASHPELLEALAAEFVAHKFDLRHLIEVIMASRSYQLASQPTETNQEDESNYSHVLVRRLTAEQLLDCQSQAAGVAAPFAGGAAGLRASQLAGIRPERGRGQKASAPERFLELFGKPPRLLTCECERSNETTMGQAFQMISGPALNELLVDPNNRLRRLQDRPEREAVTELYLAALTRQPSEAELFAASLVLRESPDRRSGMEDILWSLLNAKEFVLRQ